MRREPQAGASGSLGHCPTQNEPLEKFLRIQVPPQPSSTSKAPLLSGSHLFGIVLGYMFNLGWKGLRTPVENTSAHVTPQ